MGSATDDPEPQTTRHDDLHAVSASDRRLSPSLRVVMAVAEAIGVDSTEMEPLYETIDTEALNRLLEADGTLEVVFEYHGHAIEVGSDGHVTVDGEERGVGDR